MVGSENRCRGGGVFLFVVISVGREGWTHSLHWTEMCSEEMSYNEVQYMTSNSIYIYMRDN